MTGPLVIIVSTTVVVTVWTTHLVTNRRVTVTGGVSRDIQPMPVARVKTLTYQYIYNTYVLN